MKNFSGQSGGIFEMYAPLISKLSEDEDLEIIGLAPREFVEDFYSFPIVKVGSRISSHFPKAIRSLLYNHWLFPLALKRTNADVFLSPYFDLSFGKSMRVFITIHDMCFFEVPQCYNPLRRIYFQFLTARAASKADFILTDSESSKKEIVDRLNIPLEKISVVRNELDREFSTYCPSSAEVSKFRESFSIQSEDRLLMYSSGFESRKNLSNFLIAATESVSSNFFDLVLITGGHEIRWRNLIKNLGLDDSRFIFTGFLSSKQLKTAYLASSAMIFPSLSEGFGRPNMEAMSVGIPIACSDIAVFKEFCEDYPEYFDPNSVQSIMEALSRVATLKRLPIRYIQPYGLGSKELIDLILERDKSGLG
jgi:glycosyltransferase involved in cell wall biosynthesis